MINYETIYFSPKEVIKSYFLLVESSIRNSFELFSGHVLAYLVPIDKESNSITEEYIANAYNVFKESNANPAAHLVYVCRVLNKKEFGILISDKILRKPTIKEMNLMHKKYPNSYPFIYPDILAFKT